jgi:hypothetical protein
VLTFISLIKSKFHLKALKSLVASGAFGGDVLEHIICAEQD